MKISHLGMTETELKKKYGINYNSFTQQLYIGGIYYQLSIDDGIVTDLLPYTKDGINTSKVREKILFYLKPYMNTYKRKDLISFEVGSDYFTNDEDEDYEVPDFYELVVIVEKEWFFSYLQKIEGIEDPLDYLKNEFTWDDSYEWFWAACDEGKIVAINFN